MIQLWNDFIEITENIKDYNYKWAEITAIANMLSDKQKASVINSCRVFHE